VDVTEDRTEQLVRQTLNAVASQVRSSQDSDEESQSGDRSVASRATVTALRRNRHRSRRLVIVAACVVALLAAGGFALIAQRAEKSPHVSVNPADAPPSDTDASPPYGLPATDDEITELLPTSTSFEQSYGGTFAGANAQLTVNIQVFPDVLKKSVQSATGCSGMPAVAVNGHAGCAFSVIAQSTKEVLSWVEDSSTVIGLESTTLSRDQLLQISSNVKRDGARVSLDPVPDGLQPAGTHSDPNADNPGYVYVDFTHNDCDYMLTRQVSTTLPTGSVTVPVTINGYPGSFDRENTISWLVRGSLMTLSVGTIHTGGDPVVPQPVGPQPVAPSCDVQATATTIRYITEADWKQLVGDHSEASATNDAPATTTSPPASNSSQPQYEGDEAAIANVFETWISGPGVEATIPLIEDGEALRSAISAPPPVGSVDQKHSARVDSIRLVDDTHANVTFSILDRNGNAVLPNQQGSAVKIDSTWRVSRDTYCALVSEGGIQCPPG
jgi:hypothetical protein